MNATPSPQLLADVVLGLHFAFVAFVIGGLVFIVVGNLLTWRWVNSGWFRIGHLAAIGFVVAEAWLGLACPLTSLEMRLRTEAGVAAYGGSFVQHWLQRMLYYDAPAWVFTLVYSAFALAVVAAWQLYPPRFTRRVDQSDDTKRQE